MRSCLAVLLMLVGTTAFAATPAPSATPTPASKVKVRGTRTSVGVDTDGTVHLKGTKSTLVVGGSSVGKSGSSSTTGKVGGSAGAPAPISVDENGLHESIDCKTASITIRGNSNVLTLDHCSTVSVMGSSNKVVIGEGTRTVSVTGSSNDVSMATGVSSVDVTGASNGLSYAKALDGTVPTIRNTGSSNHILAK